MDALEYNYIHFSIRELKDRIEVLESNVFKNAKRTETTRGQQLLILKHLGLLDKIKDSGLSNTKVAKLLSVLLNTSQENIRHDLSGIDAKGSELKHETNYIFLVDFFESLGLNDQTKDCEKILKEIRDVKDIKKKQ